jgi:hypothetical protein
MRALFFVLLTASLVACTNSGKVPADIIPSHKMETILWQLMQSDEYVNTQLAKDSLKKGSTEKMKIYQQVFDLNGTSISEFKKSYHYYVAHPDITKVMFDSIAVRAGRQRTDMYKSKPTLHVKPAGKP